MNDVYYKSTLLNIFSKLFVDISNLHNQPITKNYPSHIHYHNYTQMSLYFQHFFRIHSTYHLSAVVTQTKRDEL